MLHNFENVVFKSFFCQFLHVKFVPRVQVFIFQSLVAHLEIIDNQVKVGADSLKVFDFDLHFVDLLVEIGDFVLTRQYVSLQLFNFVVEHKLELLKLLSLLF
jgi:hypothetical protein